MVFKFLENAVDKMSLDNFVYGPRQNSPPGSYHPIIFTGKKKLLISSGIFDFFWRIYSERERRELYVKCIEDVPVTLCDWNDLESCK